MLFSIVVVVAPCADNFVDVAIVIDSSQFVDGSGNILATSASDYQAVKNFVYSLNNLLLIDPSYTVEAIAQYRDGMANQNVPAQLTPFQSTSNLNAIIQALAQGTTTARSYSSLFERIRDNVFCTGTQCGDRAAAPDVVIFFAGESRIQQSGL